MDTKRQSLGEMWSRIREDRSVNGQSWWTPGCQAMAVYRFGAWLLTVGKAKRFLLRPLYGVAHLFIRNVYGIELSWRTSVGRRFRISHQSGIVIHPAAVIGDDCEIRQNVTIGAATHPRYVQAPELGNRVSVGAGAVIIGGVRIGDGAKIGPNAVITMNVPAGATVISPAVRVICPPTPNPAFVGEEASPLQEV